MSDVVEGLRGYQQGDADGVMVLVSRQACEEGAAEIEALRAALKLAETHRDMAVGLLAEWAVDVADKGSEFDEWSDTYRWALHRPGPLREMLDTAMADVRAARKLCG